MISLEVDGLAKSFAAGAVLKNVTIRASGGLLAVKGANGSGKSTLLKILAGLTPPSRGSVRFTIGGAAISLEDRRKHVGWCSPELFFEGELTGAENLRLLAEAAGAPADDARIEGLIASVGLKARLSTPVGAYSSGMLQRLRIAYSLLADPAFLLWDEPFANLDVAGRASLSAIVAGRRKTGLVALASNEPADFDRPDGEVVLS